MTMEWGKPVASDMLEYTCSKHGNVQEGVIQVSDEKGSRTLCKQCMQEILEMLPDLTGGK